MADNSDAVVLITSDALGSGDDELGRLLMRSFIKTLASADEKPSAVLFLNHGVKLTCAGSELLEDLRSLETAGVKLSSCGTCLDYLNLKDHLSVGGVGNMAGTVETLLSADRVVRP